MSLRFLLLMIATSLSTTASAQVFVSGGAATPLAPDNITNIYRSGYSFAIGFVLQNGSMPFLRFRPFGSFQRFRTDPGPFEAQFENIDEVEGGAMPVLFAGLDVQLRRPYAAFTPFIAPVFGYAVFSIDDITADGITFNLREEVTGLAAGIGGGLAYALSRRYELYVEAQYVRAFLEGENRAFVPVRLGVGLSFD